jgi:WD40 repeat protein
MRVGGRATPRARERSSAVFNPDGTLVVTASDDGTARIWNTASGRLLHILRGHHGHVHSAVFNPDGTLVVTASDDGTRIWNTASGRLLHTLGVHPGPAESAVFSPDGKLKTPALRGF